MGQRTQVIIQRVRNTGEKRTNVWHFQWGFGRQMFLQLMSLVIGDYFKNAWQEGYDYHKTVDLRFTEKADLCNQYFDKTKAEFVNGLSFRDPAQVGKVFFRYVR